MPKGKKGKKGKKEKKEEVPKEKHEITKMKEQVVHDFILREIQARHLFPFLLPSSSRKLNLTGSFCT